MALTVEIWVSCSGVADAAFSLLTSLPDTDAGFFFDHTPLSPGNLYIYRARRRDSDQAGTPCEYSAWSELVFLRAPYPEATLMRYCDIQTGAGSALWIGIEAAQNIPAKAQWRVPYTGGGIDRDAMQLFSNEFTGSLDEFSDAVEGRVQYEGSFTLNIKPEGAFPRFCLGALDLTTSDVAGHKRHRFFIGKGPRTFTLIHLKGGTYFVYTGCTVSSLGFESTKDQDSVLGVSFGIMCLNELVYEKELVPNVETLLGVLTASMDPLPSYSPVKGLARINNLLAGIKGMTFTITPKKNRNNIYDGYRGAHCIYTDGRTSIASTATLNYGDNTNVRRELLGDVVPTGPYGIGDTLGTGPVDLTFSPPDNGAGFSNQLRFALPSAAIKTSQPIDGEGAIPENLTFTAGKFTGNGANTSLYIEIDNMESYESLIAPAPTIVTVPPNRATEFSYGVMTGTPTTTTISASGAAHLSAVTDFYVNRTLIVATGTQADKSGKITAYNGTTKTFTITALPGAPSAGDVFDVS